MSAHHCSIEAKARMSAAAQRAWDSGRHPFAKPAADRGELIASMRRDGMTLKEIGQQLGITLQRVAQLLQKHKRRVERRAQHECYQVQREAA
jgi:DNA invertase Pin-like site-specific DNA recombinase